MMIVKKTNNIGSLDEVGGKGAHLQKLNKWQAPVAPFLIFTTHAYDYYLSTGSFHPEVISSVESFLTKHKTIVFRSSMVGEDNVSASFAGIFDTVLGVNSSNWVESLRKVYDSVGSPRVKAYLLEKKINTSLRMAVVMQKQINVAKSGVIFTRSPVAPHSAVAIDVAWGMGEGLVSGHVEVESYLISRTGEELSQRLIGKNPILNQDQKQDLIRKALTLESKLGCPADIEWGIDDERLYFFQIRPITQKFNPLGMYVDTNLSESYPGVVSPFTAAFVKKAYENVFLESALVLGAKEDDLKKLRPHYAELIACLGHHLYYNLEHYYAVLRSLPGGEKNIENWHNMIGGKVDHNSVSHHSTGFDMVQNVFMVIRLLKLAWFKDEIFANFLQQLNKQKTEIDSKLGQLQTPEELIQFLLQLLDRPLGFGLTLINDVFIMMGLGILSRSFKKRGLSEAVIVDLLKTSQSVDSIKPLIEFNKLISSLSPAFLELFKNQKLKAGVKPYETFFSEARSKGLAAEVDRIKEFIDNYGDRSFEELKIESLPIRNDPQLLLRLISWGQGHESSQLINSSVENSPALNWVERKVLDFTRECIEHREASRLWRGRFYHTIRDILLRLGEKLSKEKPEFQDCEIADFFSITVNEWAFYQAGRLNSLELLQLIKQRKAWKSLKRSFPEVIAWDITEDLPDFSQNVTNLSEMMKGQGVSVGEVEGVALVLENPTEILDNLHQNFILITKNTDPAWVYIMSRSRGLISEKGSLLSHTAIIGRELKLPTIVGVKNITSIIRTGEKIKMNGATGEIIKL